MGNKIFVSYKFADTSVQGLGFQSCFSNTHTKVRDYVTHFQSVVEKTGKHINKGESDGEDLSNLKEATIWNKLRDRIYDSSVTVVFISPNMKMIFKPDAEQWIAREIQYSLWETTRDDRTSHSNAMVAVVLPDTYGSYRYYDTMPHFAILKGYVVA